jgi:hypothetical protein
MDIETYAEHSIKQQQSTHSFQGHRKHFTFTHEISINKTTKIISSALSDHSNMKVEINNRRKFGKFTGMWKLINILLNSQ